MGDGIPATIRLYCDILGFTCTEHIGGWANLKKDGVELTLALPNAHLTFEKFHFTGSLYFKLDEPDALWREVKKVRVVYPVENFDYGMREFGTYDNNGYILSFGSAVFQ